MPPPPGEVHSSGDDMSLVQMNNRVPRSMLHFMECRARTLDISRDEWVRRAIEWALLQPPGTPVRASSNPRRSR